MAADWIAEARFLATPADAPPRPIIIRVGRPQPVGSAEWACAVVLEGLHGDLAPIHGADALQALTLASQLVGRLLTAFAAQGGQLTYPSGEPVPLASYWVGPA